MIVFDGDSVPSAYNLEPHLGWCAQAARGDFVNLSRIESTAEQCFGRIYEAMAANPDLYVIQVGQWSHNHEKIEAFEDYLRKIIETLRLAGINICIVTPPTQHKSHWNVQSFVAVLAKIATIYQTMYVDLYNYMKERDTSDWIIPDHALCHFNEYGSKMVAAYFNSVIHA